MKVYLSGGMNGNWQSRVVEALPHVTFINPQEHDLLDPIQYTAADLLGIRMSDVVFCYLDNANPSGVGMALEMGYAKALGKTIVFVIERLADERFFIAEKCADACFLDMDDGIAFLRALARYL